MGNDTDFDDGSSVETLGHDHIPVEIPELSPTCTEDGLTKGIKCKDCDKILIEQTTIPATGHTLGSWTIDKFADWGVDGIKHAICSVCGETVTVTLQCSEGLEYGLNDDGTYYLKGIGKCTDADIVVPVTYNGTPVTAIGHCAFMSNYDITSVIVPYGVTSIGDSSFSWCDNLRYINLPESVTYIGNSAFWYCFDLTELSIPDVITYIGEGAFGCTGLSSISIDESNTFYHVSGNCLIESKTGKLLAGFNDSVIPDDGSVTAIASNAFAGCGELKSIVIPPSVKTIGGSAFYCCGSLESIIFSEGLESIGYNVFNACSNLTSIRIPDSVIEIGGSAFTWCQGLESVIIGKGIANISSGAFNQCTSLKDIFYVGSESEWDSISKADDWDSNAGDYKIHYNYAD